MICVGLCADDSVSSLGDGTWLIGRCRCLERCLGVVGPIEGGHIGGIPSCDGEAVSHSVCCHSCSSWNNHMTFLTGEVSWIGIASAALMESIVLGAICAFVITKGVKWVDTGFPESCQDIGFGEHVKVSTAINLNKIILCDTFPIELMLCNSGSPGLLEW